MKDRPLLTTCLILLMIINVNVFGWGEKCIAELQTSPLEKMVSDGEDIVIQGTIYQIEKKSEYQVLYLKNNSIQFQKSRFQEARFLAYIQQPIQFKIGNRVNLSGELTYYQSARNPGNFNQKLYYRKQNIRGFVWAEKTEIIDANYSKWRQSLSTFRQSWKDILIHEMGQEDGSALAAMMLGEKSSMDQELKELYQINGIGHILAISGLHLSFIGVGFYLLVRRGTGSYLVAGIVGIAFLLTYILMIGLTVSAVRALVMFLFRVGADMTGRHYDAPTALGMAAVVALVWRPLYLYDGGFWLSFGAVLAILAVYPLVQIYPVQGFWASLSIQITLMPILLYFFYEIPIYSTLLNIIVIPCMSLILALGMGGSLLYCVWAPCADIPFAICRGILWIYEKLCQAAVELPAARWIPGQPKLWQMFIYYGILMTIVVLAWRNHLCVKKRIVCPIWVMACVVLVFPFGEKGTVQVTMLDVGQGDGIFVRGPAGGTYFIDGGSSDVKKVGQYRIESFLKSQGAGELDYVFITHGDSDHMNGIEEMLDRQKVGIRIRHLVLPCRQMWDESLEELAEKAKGAGVTVMEILPEQGVKEGDLAWTCIQPEKTAQLEPGNEASMVLALQFGHWDMLLTGDVEGRGEEVLTEKLREEYGDVKWEVLKVAHHGSKNSSSVEFLEAVQPTYAMISAGQENRYGHPHKETLDRLRDIHAEIQSTQKYGAIKIVIRLNSYRFLFG